MSGNPKGGEYFRQFFPSRAGQVEENVSSGGLRLEQGVHRLLKIPERPCDRFVIHVARRSDHALQEYFRSGEVVLRKNGFARTAGQPDKLGKKLLERIQENGEKLLVVILQPSGVSG